jgi:hypothetical protein
MQSGKSMPVDADPVIAIPSIDVVSEKDEGFITKDGFILPGRRVFIARKVFVPHWSTCHNADSHRRKES